MRKALLRLSALTLFVVAFIAASASTAWADPDPKPGLPGGLEGKLNTMLGMLYSLGIFAGVAGFMICGILMVLAFRRGEAGEKAALLGVVGAGCVVLGSASSIAMFLI